MFATLVIQLPSYFQGGKLVVKHAGRTHTHSQCGVQGEAKLYWTAFYADCDHELLPITSGHRAVLIYNLVQTGSCRSAADLFSLSALLLMVERVVSSCAGAATSAGPGALPKPATVGAVKDFAALVARWSAGECCKPERHYHWRPSGCYDHPIAVWVLEHKYTQVWHPVFLSSICLYQ